MRSSAPGHEVGLDAEAQVGLLAHERAVLVEVVVRELAPEAGGARRRAPGGSGRRARRRPARRSPARAPRRGSARRWRAREVALRGRRVGVVGAQVEVVVGEHSRARFKQDRRGRSGRARSPSSSSASAQVERGRDLEVLAPGRARRSPARRRARPARRRRSPARASCASTSSARSSAARRKTCGVCTAHSSPRSSVSRDRARRRRPA